MGRLAPGTETTAAPARTRPVPAPWRQRNRRGGSLGSGEFLDGLPGSRRAPLAGRPGPRDRRRTRRPDADGAPAVDRGPSGEPVREAPRVHPHPDGPACPLPVADSVESYSTDYIDGDTVAAVFEPAELEQVLAFRRSISPELMALLREWGQGFCPLNAIESTLSDLIGSRGSNGVRRIDGDGDRGRGACDGGARRPAGRLHGQQLALARPAGAGPPGRRSRGREHTRQSRSNTRW